MKDLTPRQLAVARALARAWPSKRIAVTLAVDERTVRAYITAIAEKIGVDQTCSTRMQIAFWFREQAPITVDDAPLPDPSAFQESENA